MAAAKVMWRAAWLTCGAILVVGGCGKAPDSHAEPTPIDGDVPAEIPTLSPADIAAADEIMADLPTSLPDLDKTLLGLLSRLPQTSQGPWHSGSRLIGVARNVSFRDPLTLGPVSLPDASWDNATDDYTPFTHHYDSIVGLRNVSILIDLEVNRVVAIQPGDAKEINPSAKTVYPRKSMEDAGERATSKVTP